MSVSNSSARAFEGQRVKPCHTDAMLDSVAQGRVERYNENGVIGMVRRTGVKRVTRGSKKYKQIMEQHQAILLVREENK